MTTPTPQHRAALNSALAGIAIAVNTATRAQGTEALWDSWEALHQSMYEYQSQLLLVLKECDHWEERNSRYWAGRIPPPRPQAPSRTLDDLLGDL